MHRGTRAEISLRAVSRNLAVIRRLCGGRPVIAVVKADAYGHGAVEISRQLVRDGVNTLAVAFGEEARELREAGIDAPLIALFDADPEAALSYNLIAVVSDRKAGIALSREAEKAGRRLPVHFKVDTGMGRLGFRDGAVTEILALARLGGISVRGILSHLSDADMSDAASARRQVEGVRSLRAELEREGLFVPCFHVANSAALLSLPESRFDAVRPGLLLYGCWPLEEPEHAVEGSTFEPAMSVRARIVALRRMPAGSPVSYGGTFVTKRDSLIAVVSAGYADGYLRGLSNRAEVLAAGVRAPVVGRVCMDLSMIDVTGIEGLSEGGDVVLLGREGRERITASELASRAGTIPYEILTSLGSRARRSYFHGQTA